MGVVLAAVCLKLYDVAIFELNWIKDEQTLVVTSSQSVGLSKFEIALIANKLYNYMAVETNPY